MKVALETFVEIVPTIAVERWLLSDLPDLIPPKDAYTMDEPTISRIASEPVSARQQRTKLSSQRAVLKDVIDICQPYVTYDSGKVQIHLKTIRNFR